MNRLLTLMVMLPASLPALAATPDPAQSALETFLTEPIYLIEFFVFERTPVMEFNTQETLALERPRAFPHAMRTQRLDPDYLWEGPLDELTRSCLTFPTLIYQLDEFPAPVEDPSTAEGAAPVEQTPIDPRARPVPDIHPALGADPLLDLMSRIAEYQRSLVAQSYGWLPGDQLVLAREAARVERTGIGRVLFHGRWMQPVPPRDQPDPILIQAGDQLGPPLNVRELEGTVGVTLGRYLHFRADLYFHAPGLGLTPVMAPMTAEGGIVPERFELPEGRYMLLSESRRMRSTETHYLDHPKLGLVVRIDPVLFPSELVEAFEAYEERAEQR